MIPLGWSTVYFPSACPTSDRVAWVMAHKLPGGIYRGREFWFNPCFLVLQ